MQNWIAKLFEQEELLMMGHCQRLDDLNLGLGWLYYGLTRIIRPQIVVVIGSWRGFSTLVFAKGISDNLEDGKIIFIDPSFVDNFWKDEANVQEYFGKFGVQNIQHFLMTTQKFVTTKEYQQLQQVDILFIDSHHSKEQAQFDYEAFAPLLSKEGIILFHDSCTDNICEIYGEDNSYQYTVQEFIANLKKDHKLQVLDLGFDQGLTLVRKI